MGKQLFTNNAAATLYGTLPQGATTLILAQGTGGYFPAPADGDYFLATLYEKNASGEDERIEIVRVIGRVADALTIERDFEEMVGEVGGYAYPSSVGKTVFVELRWTAWGAGNVLQRSANFSDLDNPLTAKVNLGLSNVDNTTDANKPISSATQAALNLKAPLASPALTGIPTAPKPALGTNTNQLAPTSFVHDTITALINASPETLNTLNELAAALGNDPNFATTVANALALRVEKTSNTGAFKPPVGTTAQRPGIPTYGDTRVNSELGIPEWWNGSAWIPTGGGQMLGQALVKAIHFNSQTIDEDLVIKAGTNGFSAGPISITPGHKVDFEPGANWVITGG